ncbi:arginyltransferase [Pseudoalteromonas sp. SSM20]|uniref:arginyltransferase n=1 Tax=Pseudoalteromonas sp. SSM20 TaxID=3139394 RepID=UPI003BA9A5CD
MTEHMPVKLGISQQFPCSYIDNEQERLLVVLDHDFYTQQKFEHLLALGFRRSSDQIYRPHCPSCNACKAIRLEVSEFKPSRSQKRIIAKSNEFRLESSKQSKDIYYTLYEKYIVLRHHDGAMFPPSIEQYESFLTCSWLNINYLELWHQDKLIAVAVTDTLFESLSAIYTFFDPEYEHYSLGTMMILKQIEFAKQLNKRYLYLGYQIDACRKMNYKTKFNPYQKLNNNVWQLEIKK